jgi:hypothetical protein
MKPHEWILLLAGLLSEMLGLFGTFIILWVRGKNDLKQRIEEKEKELKHSEELHNQDLTQNQYQFSIENENEKIKINQEWEKLKVAKQELMIHQQELLKKLLPNKDS